MRAAALVTLLALSARGQEAAPPPPAALAQPPARDASALAVRIAERLTRAAADPCLASARVGAMVRDAETGEVIYERDPDAPLAPASNMKLLTGTAAQDLLGPERTLKTSFRADRKPDASGSVGTLYVVGGGDPSVTIESLYLAARELAMRGVRRVDAIVVDDAFFAGPTRPPSWPVRNHSAWYGAPSSALGANFNVVAVHATGGARVGVAPSVFVDPFPSFFDVRSTLRTAGGTQALAAKGTLVVDDAGRTTQRLDVSGRLRPGRAHRALVPVEDPALFAGHGVAESLRRVGVEVGGGVRRARAPEGSVLLHAHASKPLALVVRDMEKESSNMFAETLLKVLGAEFYGAPGSREKGLDVLRAWIGALAPGGCACQLADGSGLSPDNRLTARALTDLLLGERRHGAAFPDLLAALPVSGADGTLRKRLDEHGAARLVRAKTGRISRVAALSGYASIGEGRTAVFSILVNEYACATWKAEAALDAMVTALVLDAPPATDWRQRLNLPPHVPEPVPAEEVPDGEVEDEPERADEPLDEPADSGQPPSG